MKPTPFQDFNSQRPVHKHEVDMTQTSMAGELSLNYYRTGLFIKSDVQDIGRGTVLIHKCTPTHTNIFGNFQDYTSETVLSLCYVCQNLFYT